MTPTCQHCGRITDMVDRDGDRPVCRPCIRSRGSWAAEPLRLPVIEIAVLERLHGDVVRLVRREWRWDPTWPGVGMSA